GSCGRTHSRRGFSSRCDCYFVRWSSFSGTHDPGDGLAYGHFGSSLHLDAGENAFAGGFDLHHGFVGFDLEQWFAFGDRLSFFFEPRNELASFLGHFKRGHNHTDRHSLITVRMREYRNNCRAGKRRNRSKLATTQSPRFLRSWNPTPCAQNAPGWGTRPRLYSTIT